MASPQLENGYTTIANELLDALCRIRVPGEATQVLMAILRKTYGFKRKEDEIALSQICAITGLDRPTVCRAINKLVEMNLIGKKANGKKGNILAINKDHNTWKPLVRRVVLAKRITDLESGKKATPGVANMPMVVGENANEVVAETPHTKERVKTTIKTIVTNVTGAQRNPYVDELLKTLREKLGTDTLDGSEKLNRRYAWLLLGKCKYKLSPEIACQRAKSVLEMAFKDSFHAGNATSMRYLYNNAVKIVASERQKSLKNNIIGL